MGKPVVPKIVRGSGSDTPPSSDMPTYAIVGASVAAAIGTGAWAGFGVGIVVGIISLVVLGGLYSVIAYRLGWPPIRWETIPFFLP